MNRDNTQAEVPAKSPDEVILARVLRAKSVSAAAITYWDIIVTNRAVYFLRMADNYAPLIGGAVTEAAIISGKKKDQARELESFLQKSIQVIKVEPAQFDYMQVKGKKIILQSDDKKTRIKMPGKYVAAFTEAISQLKQ
ncbi:hypothetical protein ACFL2B_02890 [Patescibacteria group bacterium]